MRLLKYDQDGKVTLTEDLLNEDAIPPYAILSHTWGNEEVTFEELTNGSGELKDGYKKIRFCMEQAAKDGIHHSWVDTCCIKKTDITELQHAINSMYRWYREAAVCYVFLTDVSLAKRKADSESSQHSWEPAFRDSRWFTRGWTLQELLAPRKLRFFSREGNLLGDIYSLKGLVHSITSLPIAAIEGASTDEFSIEERLTWTKDRKTTREEDKAYSLLGIFGIYMPLIYGEREENAFRRLRKEIQERRYTTQASLIFSERDFACLQSLSYPEQEHRHNDIHRATGTCDWLLHDPKYNLWMKRSHGSFWVRGDPGSGKSVLMKHAVRSTVAQFTKEVVVSYFIHGQGSELQQTPLGVYRALLNSLLGHFPAYLSKLATIFGEREARFGGYLMGRWSWSSNELQESLTDLLLHHTQQRQVTIFVDALDECGEGPARKLMAYFSHLTKQAGDLQAKVRICVSSRYYPILALDDLPSISVEERNNEDIRWFVNDKLSALPSSPIRQKVLEEIMSKAQGGFQWALLVTDLVIDRKFSGRSVLGQVASCPSTLSELYASLLNDGTKSEKRQAVKLFRWIIFARRPLSAQELREALATDPDMRCTSVADMRKCDEWSETLEDFERYVTYISKGLVKFESREIWEQWEESSHEAQLIHQSVADFLTEDFAIDTCEGTTGAGHFLISRSCLNYLTIKDLLDQHHLSRDALSSRFPLAPYAVRYVFVHIAKAELAGCVQSDLLSALRWSPHSELMRQLVDLWRILNPHNIGTPHGWPFVGSSERHVLAALGSKSGLLALQESQTGARYCQDLDGNTPLHVALSEGHLEIASLLISEYREWEQQATARRGYGTSEDDYSVHWEIQSDHLNAHNSEDDTALDIAVAVDARAVFKELLALGADVEAMHLPYSAILYAIFTRDLTMIEELIDHYTDFKRALHVAVQQDSSHEIILRLLKADADASELPLEEEIDIDAEYTENNILHLACQNLSVELVKLLLSNGISARCPDRFKRCPIHVALIVSDDSRLDDHLKILKHLLEADPSIVELEDDRGHTALDIALEQDRECFVVMLLELGQFSVPSPILRRLFRPENKIHKLLLGSDGEGPPNFVGLLDHIDPTLNDHHGRTVLWKAASRGLAAITKQLLERTTVSLNTRDASGASPLLAAVRNRHVEVVEALLLVQGIRVNDADYQKDSPLHVAVKNADHGTVRLLLGVKSIDINVKDEGGATPLVKAILTGQKIIAQTLLDRKDISAEGRFLAAVAAVDIAGVERSTINNPWVDLRELERYARAALKHAVEAKDDYLVGLLLSTHDFAAEPQVAHGRSILTTAVRSSSASIVKLLIEANQFDLNMIDGCGDSPLWIAMLYGCTDIVKLLLDQETVNVNSPVCAHFPSLLWWPARNAHEHIYKMFLAIDRVDLDITNEDGDTLLVWAVKAKNRTLITSILETGRANINHTDRHGMTAILHAVQDGETEIAKMLRAYSQRGT